MIARLSRIVPLLVLLGIVAAAVYVVVAWRSSPNRAKEILIRLFTWLCGVLSAFFALAAAYAAFERNWVAVEIALTFFGTVFVGLVVTRICRRVFIRNHPAYRNGALQAEVVNPPLWQRIVQRVLEKYLRR